MVYEFLTDEGTVLEADYPMSKAPTVGAIVEIDGVRAVRIASHVNRGITPMWKPYVSQRLPRNLDIPGVINTPGGKPYISSQAVERRVAATIGWERD